MPVGRVRYFDAEKGFGFIVRDDTGGDVYFRISALAAGTSTVRRGQRVEFGVVEGKKGEQALTVTPLQDQPSLAKAARKDPEAMVIIVEDLIKMLDSLSTGYRRNRYPDSRYAHKVAQVMRAFADELEL